MGRVKNLANVGIIWIMWRKYSTSSMQCWSVIIVGNKVFSFLWQFTYYNLLIGAIASDSSLFCSCFVWIQICFSCKNSCTCVTGSCQQIYLIHAQVTFEIIYIFILMNPRVSGHEGTDKFIGLILSHQCVSVADLGQKAFHFGCTVFLRVQLSSEGV